MELPCKRKKATAPLGASLLAAPTVGLADTLAAHRPQQDKQKQKGTIRVQTNLVNILANVTDAKGEPVVGLGQSAFQLFEEGVEQKIVRFEPQTNRPLDLALMVDTSGSEGMELKNRSDPALSFC